MFLIVMRLMSERSDVEKISQSFLHIGKEHHKTSRHQDKMYVVQKILTIEYRKTGESLKSF